MIKNLKFNFCFILFFLLFTIPHSLNHFERKASAEILLPNSQLTAQKIEGFGSLETAMIAALYKVDANLNPDSDYQAQNIANRFTTHFDKNGFRIFIDKDERNLKTLWRLKSVGRGEHQNEVSTEETKAERNHFEIRYKSVNVFKSISLTEWFENKPEGLEHGFTLPEKPPQESNQNLRLIISVTGDLMAKGDDDGQGLTLLTRDGSNVFRYEKLKVWDATSKILPARIFSRNRQVMIDVEDKTAVYPLTIDPIFKPHKALAASDGNAYDRFGKSVAIDGNTAIIGANCDSIGSNNCQGSAYIFKRSGNNWYQEAKLTAGDGAANDKFGSSVSLSGNSVIIGAPLDDISANQDQGSAYIFVRNGYVWSQQWKLTAGDGAPNDYFGASVDIDFNSVVVGSNGDDICSNHNQGSAYVFIRNGPLWFQQVKLTASNGAVEDQFGHAVAISGNTVVVGAHFYNSYSDTSKGSAYVFTGNGGSWNQIQKLIPNDDANAPVGWDVDIAGDTAVVSLFNPPYSIPSSKPRAVYVFARNASPNWSQQAKLTDTGSNWEFREFGKSIAVDKNTIVVGAPSHHDHPPGLGWDGEVHTFFRSVYNNVWFNQQKLTAFIESDPNNFGHAHGLGTSVGVSGNFLIAGDPYESLYGHTQQGSAYIFAAPTRKATLPYYELPFYYPKFRIILDTDWIPDLAVFRQGIFQMRSTENGVSETNLGLASDVPVPADYDGDGITDLAVFRDGLWLINQSSEGFRQVNHGQRGDVPVPGFFDSDNLADFAVFRNGIWHLLQSRDGFETVGLGVGADQPFAADFDGDELYDPAVFRDGTWFWLSSETGEIGEVRLGGRGDVPVIEDFDGDFIADFGVFNRGVWQIQQSDEGYRTFEFGEAGDIPVTSDYDVDGKADAAVFRDGLWLIEQSSAGLAEIEFGQTGDIPLPVR